MQRIVRLSLCTMLGVGIGLAGNALHPHRVSIGVPPLQETATCSAPLTILPLGIQWMSVPEAKERLSLFSELLIGDTRSEPEYKHDHLSHAVHLPCKVGLNKAFPLPAPELLLYDQQGNSPGLMEAAQEARKSGFSRVFLLQGGFQEWKTQFGEIESGPCSSCSTK